MAILMDHGVDDYIDGGSLTALTHRAWCPDSNNLAIKQERKKYEEKKRQRSNDDIADI